MGEHVAPASPTSKKRSNIFWNIVGVVGELLITFAFVIGLFSVWQLYWTTYQVSGQVSQTIASYEEEHQPAKRTLGEVRTDDPPEFTREVGDGEVYGLIHVPTWDWMKIPLAEGTTSYVLDQGWAGHYDMTTQPGGVGNFSVAGHRRTYGNNFRWIDRLSQGDKVVVEVDDHYLVYSMVSSEIIDATDPTQMDDHDHLPPRIRQLAALHRPPQVRILDPQGHGRARRTRRRTHELRTPHVRMDLPPPARPHLVQGH